jgi:hypothetical protein
MKTGDRLRWATHPPRKSVADRDPNREDGPMSSGSSVAVSVDL